MRVAVNESRKHGGLRQIDDLSPGGNLKTSSGPHSLNPLAFDRDYHVLANVVTGGIEQPPRADVGDRRRLWFCYAASGFALSFLSRFSVVGLRILLGGTQGGDGKEGSKNQS